ncbi:peptidylprolyl isomerase [Nocardioides sp. TF02-7]|uniref:peptidylprolyl isomerase n=1 Tax=Nocardioides sp. TF02-7 TaxID=2917724 RepID=UPI001F05D48C|nr:peptidylprolyl isomerase [Nocardioides sp. TF02-7]UMG92274.1 peptidylprolyl isomerase [Nocardioides sp. TF02-7]
MSSNKQRKARRKAEREHWEREQARVAERRRRVRLVGVFASVGAVVVGVGLVVALTAGDDSDQSAEDQAIEDTDLLASEAAADAHASAAAEATAAGEVLADDFTVEPGTPVDSGRKPALDDRPVACGGKVPANAAATRPRYPGGPAEMLEEGVDYVAVIETSCGPITIDLLEKDAPVTVNSFVFLAREGFYDGLEVFRDFGGITAVQTGSGDNSVGWDVGYRLPDELERAEREGYPIGTVTTAGEGPYTAGSQFYIAYGTWLDDGFRDNRIHTTFGRVLSGMEVIDTMTAMERVGMGGEAFAERLFMESVTIQQR